jgi:hypothetical protein
MIVDCSVIRAIATGLVSLLLVSCKPVVATRPETGRFVIVSHNDPEHPTVVKMDSTTGRAWRLTALPAVSFWEEIKEP